MTTAEKLQLAMKSTRSASAARETLYAHASQNGITNALYPHAALQASDEAVQAAHAVQLALERELEAEQDDPIAEIFPDLKPARRQPSRATGLL